MMMIIHHIYIRSFLDTHSRFRVNKFLQNWMQHLRTSTTASSKTQGYSVLIYDALGFFFVFYFANPAWAFFKLWLIIYVAV